MTETPSVPAMAGLEPAGHACRASSHCYTIADLLSLEERRLLSERRRACASSARMTSPGACFPNEHPRRPLSSAAGRRRPSVMEARRIAGRAGIVSEKGPCDGDMLVARRRRCHERAGALILQEPDHVEQTHAGDDRDFRAVLERAEGRSHSAAAVQRLPGPGDYPRRHCAHCLTLERGQRRGTLYTYTPWRACCRRAGRAGVPRGGASWSRCS
ncbi:hypothetical protein SSTU70S_00676 [Stutzerimonas stutzeri]